MPISSEELTKRLQDAYPRILEMRKTAIELQKVGEQVRRERKSEDKEAESNSFKKLK